MNQNNIITNQELQESITQQIRSVDSGKADSTHVKIYFIGARTLLTAVKLDVEGAKKLGVPLFDRTKAFLGVG